MSKNIIVFSDGTGKEGGKGESTNVYKLFNMVLDRSPGQIAFYDRGLGTGWRKLTGLAAGNGISKNIVECYEFVFDHYQAGDKIFLFGFSRGATTVRSLSGFIHLFGILPKSRRDLIKKAYKIYKIDDRDRRQRKAKEFVDLHHTMWARVNFLGVWDTVAALGLPSKPLNALINLIPGWQHKYHDLRISPSVESGYHALAIDDERKSFHPKLWDPEHEDYQSIEQVWFTGMHSDVGGGYREDGLSDIALDWLMGKAELHGLHIHERLSIDPNPHGVLHDSRGEGMAKLYRKERRTWPYETHGKPVIHPSVIERHKKAENGYAPWILEREHDVYAEAGPADRGAAATGREPAATTADSRG